MVTRAAGVPGSSCPKDPVESADYDTVTKASGVPFAEAAVAQAEGCSDRSGRAAAYRTRRRGIATLGESGSGPSR
jgi:hypothetical protein